MATPPTMAAPATMAAPPPMATPAPIAPPAFVPPPVPAPTVPAVAVPAVPVAAAPGTGLPVPAIPAAAAGASPGTAGLASRGNELTAEGLVKRAPGAAITANGRAAAAEAGAFRRLPVPGGPAEAGDAAVDRFQAMSRFQRAVAHGRGAGAIDAGATDDAAPAAPRAARATEEEGSR
jgi:hypothetical protein